MMDKEPVAGLVMDKEPVAGLVMDKEPVAGLVAGVAARLRRSKAIKARWRGSPLSFRRQWRLELECGHRTCRPIRGVSAAQRWARCVACAMAEYDPAMASLFHRWRS
jgi:hypothetical protein